MKLKKPKFWDYKKPSLLSYILFPLSKLFEFISLIKIKKKKNFENIKCICIGNIYLGGTGKTSLAIEIKKILDKKNIKSCFIKKNYPDQIDEQILLSKFGKTFIHNSRIEALKKAILEKYEIAIFDDGLQDKSISYDLSFVCFNKKNLIGNGYLIPAGPLRENLKSLNRYKNVFLNGTNENNENFKIKLLKKFPDLNFYETNYKLLNLDEFNINDNFVVFSGIGNHSTFLNMLIENKFKIIKDIEFPDHYNYSSRDVEKIYKIAKKNNSKILTTEKDFVKLKNEDKKNIKFTKISLEIIEIEKLKEKLKIKNEVN